MWLGLNKPKVSRAPKRLPENCCGYGTGSFGRELCLTVHCFLMITDVVFF